MTEPTPPTPRTTSPTRPLPREMRLGWWLVVAQFALLAVLAVRVVEVLLSGSAGLRGVAGGLLVVFAFALGAWALAANRPGNFNVHPRPRARGVLVRHGPYRWVRHPMYSALLLGAAGVALASAGWVDALAALALLGVLTVKSRLEERWMATAHPDYAGYRARTGRFVPGL